MARLSDKIAAEEAYDAALSRPLMVKVPVPVVGRDEPRQRRANGANPGRPSRRGRTAVVPRSLGTGSAGGPGLQTGLLRPDIVAGVVLAAILVPQGMAYAELAGLPPVTGLYTTIGCLVGYAVFGPSRVLVLGPIRPCRP